MISLDELILRVRDKCPSFEKRVGGTAAFAEQLTGINIKLPACFIIPIYSQNMDALFYDSEADENKIQDIRDYVATICVVDNTVGGAAGGDTMKLNAVNELVKLEKELKRAFMGWRPIQRFRPLRYARGAHIAMDNTRMWHQFEWYLTYEDNPDANPALEAEIDAIVNGVSSTEPVEVDLAKVLERIYITYKVNPDDVDSLQDFWKRSVGNPDSVPKSQGEIEQVKQNADRVEVVKPPTISLESPIPNNAYVTPHADPEFFQHGPEGGSNE